MPDRRQASLFSTGAALGLLPIAALQNARLRSETMATRAPPGQREGEAGDMSGPVLKLLLVGDSSAVGGGCGEMKDSLAPRLAYGLGMRLRRRVRWQVVGGVGWTVAQMDSELRRAEVPEADIVLVLCGVNDAAALTSRSTFRRQLDRLTRRVFDAGARLIAYSGVPEFDLMPGLGWPLGPLLGARCRQLDRVVLELTHPAPLAPERSLCYVPVPPVNFDAHVAADGLHPSSAGYAHWAAQIAGDLGREFLLLPQLPNDCQRSAVL